MRLKTAHTLLEWDTSNIHEMAANGKEMNTRLISGDLTVRRIAECRSHHIGYIFWILAIETMCSGVLFSDFSCQVGWFASGIPQVGWCRACRWVGRCNRWVWSARGRRASGIGCLVPEPRPMHDRLFTPFYLHSQGYLFSKCSNSSWLDKVTPASISASPPSILAFSSSIV